MLELRAIDYQPSWVPVTQTVQTAYVQNRYNGGGARLVSDILDLKHKQNIDPLNYVYLLPDLRIIVCR